MVITFSPETPIFDAETGNPVDMTEAETGTVVYAYIGDAMAMSEPPITNGQLFFVHVTDVSAVPVYTEIESVKKLSLIHIFVVGGNKEWKSAWT